MNVKTVGEKAPHINYDIFIHPNSASAHSQVAKKNAKHVNSSQYGMKSLYNNEISNYMDAMHISQRKNAQRGGPGGYGCNTGGTSYALAHGDPLWRRTGHVGQEMPSFDEMR